MALFDLEESHYKHNVAACCVHVEGHGHTVSLLLDCPVAPIHTMPIFIVFIFPFALMLTILLDCLTVPFPRRWSWGELWRDSSLRVVCA